MALFTMEQVSFTYAGAATKALEGIDLTIDQGDFAVLAGTTGSGKTTLLRLLKNQVRPEGTLSGVLHYEGIPLTQVDDRRSVEEIGMVFQDPDNQLVTHTVWQELFFGLENLGYSPEMMQRRVGEVVNYFGIGEYLHQPVHALSGGQKQIVNLAAVMALRPRILLLDEPTAQLDPVASREFLGMLYRLHREMGITIIISEHRLEGLVPMAHKMLVLDQGRIRFQGGVRKVMQAVWEAGDQRFMGFIPETGQLYLQLASSEKEEEIPVTVQEGQRWFQGFFQSACGELSTGRGPLSVQKDLQADDAPMQEENLAVRCQDLFFRYEKNGPLILNRLSLALPKGHFFVLLGGNGSGKTTLLRILAGIRKPQRGKIFYQGVKQPSFRGTVGYLAQNPLAYLSEETVEELFRERIREMKGTNPEKMFRDIIHDYELEEMLRQHPFDLSGGEQQKIALSLVLMSDPELVLLDEPTKGLDRDARHRLGMKINEMKQQGKTILMASHDVEFAARYADKCGMIFDGKIHGTGETRSFFSDNCFYTTTIHRVVGQQLKNAVTLKDVIQSCSRQ